MGIAGAGTARGVIARATAWWDVWIGWASALHRHRAQISILILQFGLTIERKVWKSQNRIVYPGRTRIQGLTRLQGLDRGILSDAAELVCVGVHRSGVSARRCRGDGSVHDQINP